MAQTAKLFLGISGILILLAVLTSTFQLAIQKDQNIKSTLEQLHYSNLGSFYGILFIMISTFSIIGSREHFIPLNKDYNDMMNNSQRSYDSSLFWSQSFAQTLYWLSISGSIMGYIILLSH